MALPVSSVHHLQTLRDAMALVGDAARGAHPHRALPPAMGRLAGAFQRHMSDCGGSDGLLTMVASDAPRLIAEVEDLRREHLDISEEIRALRLRLKVEDGPSPGTREEIMALLDLLAQHDQREVGLMLDAYNVDVGGGD